MVIFSSIYQLLCFVEFLAEIGIFYSVVAYQVDTAAEEFFEFMQEVEKCVGPVEAFAVDCFGIEIYGEVYVAVVVEAGG